MNKDPVEAESASYLHLQHYSAHHLGTKSHGKAFRSQTAGTEEKGINMEMFYSDKQQD